MDRSADLRAQMKRKKMMKMQQSSSSSSSSSSSLAYEALSGKEKAKYLKLLREKRKEEMPPSREKPTRPVTDMTVKTEVKPTRVVSTSHLVSSSYEPTSSSSQNPKQAQIDTTTERSALSGLAGYENSDDENEAGERGANCTPAAGAAVSSHDLPIGFFDNASSENGYESMQAKPQERVPVIEDGSENSSLPAGFFDNRADDLEARGVDLKAAASKLKKHENSQFEAFLDEMDAIESTAYQVEGSSGTLEDEYDRLMQKQEASETEMMDTAVQLAYEARVASLLAKSDKKRKDLSQDEDENDVVTSAVKSEADTLLQYMGETQVNRDDPGVSNEFDVTNSVLSAISKKQKKKKKEKKEAFDDEKFRPLDYTDWTSKSL